MDEDSDRVPSLEEAERTRTFSPPSQRPSFQPWNTRANTHTGTGFQRQPSSENLLRRQRSRQFSRTSVDTDSILLDRSATRRKTTAEEESDDGTEQWHSIALIFVAAPAFAGMFFENGSAVMTDVLMLGLGCLFLYWSVKWPWQWYYSTQELKLAEVEPMAEFAVVEESDEEQDSNGRKRDAPTAQSPGEEREQRQTGRPEAQRTEAIKALQSLEIMALTSCFAAPGAVAYMLHSIRPYLSRPSGGVVSNSNLTLFVLAAELRPILHFFKLVEERTLHLQRIVTSLPASEEKQLEERVEILAKRLVELETSGLAEQAGSKSAEKRDENATISINTSDVERGLRQNIQPQLDALNRAVRRYEKRATTQAIVMEARLQDLEARLKDALSLAAAASRNSQKAGLIGHISDAVKWMLTKPFEALSQLFLLPFQLAGDVWRFLFGPRRKKKKSPTSTKYTSDFKGKQRLEAR